MIGIPPPVGRRDDKVLSSSSMTNGVGGNRHFGEVYIWFGLSGLRAKGLAVALDMRWEHERWWRCEKNA